jgi:hypothetical protein
MSPERLPGDPMVNILGPLDGARVLGGCEHCDAWQTVSAVSAGVWGITVHHDDWCPIVAERKER